MYTRGRSDVGGGGGQGRTQVRKLQMLAKTSSKLRTITTGVLAGRFGSVLEMDWCLVCSWSVVNVQGERT